VKIKLGAKQLIDKAANLAKEFRAKDDAVKLQFHLQSW
jgi:hypothetical protein